MKLYQRIIAGGLARLDGLLGCVNKKESSVLKVRKLENMAAQSIRKIDLYNNGEESIVAAFKTGYGDMGIYLFIRKGDSFQEGIKISDKPAEALEVMDINGDGFHDIVYGFHTGYGGTGINILINNQNGTFSPKK